MERNDASAGLVYSFGYCPGFYNFKVWITAARKAGDLGNMNWNKDWNNWHVLGSAE